MMKKILVFAIFVFFLSAVAEAAIHVVCNKPGSEAGFSSIQSAIEQAQPFDTILVKGSMLNYGNALLEKPLTLISESAFYNDSSRHTSKLTRILLTSNPFRRMSASGSRIIGFEFPYFAGQRANIITVGKPGLSIDNIYIERNRLWFVDVVGDARNWTFVNNIIRGRVSGNVGSMQENATLENFVMYNNILNSMRGFHGGELRVQNNVILGRLQDISGAEFISNIFTREEIILNDVWESHFSGNIAMGEQLSSEDDYDRTHVFESAHKASGKVNTGNRNQVGHDPGFLYWPASDILGGAVFSMGQTGNRAGGQAGIFGGSYPFPQKFFMKTEIEDPFPSFVTSIY